MKDVSFLLGTYNRRELLTQAVASIRAFVDKTQLSYEIVVVNGPSTDGTLKFLAASSMSDIVLVTELELGGAVRAFNRAFACSQGRYIVTLNDDMIIDGDLNAALQHFDDPRIGQVAFYLTDKDTKDGIPRIQTIHNKPYVNFGIIPRTLVEEIEAICGGLWAPAYKTYGADCELSAWVWRLGLAVVGEPAVTVHDLGPEDTLRQTNNEGAAADGHTLYARWPSAAHLDPYGPLSEALEPHEVEALFRCSGRAPAIQSTSSSLDAPRGTLPAWAPPNPDERALLVYISHPTEPQDALVRTFGDIWRTSNVVSSPHYPAFPDHADLLVKAKALEPTLVFVQAQWPTLFPIELARTLKALPSNPTIVIWSGDVAGLNSHRNFSWFAELGKNVDLTLHSSMTHVRHLRAAGLFNVSCMQCGFDDHLYSLGPDELWGQHHDIAFIYNPHGRELILSLPESQPWMRDGVARALRLTSKRVKLGGGIDPREVPSIYHRSFMAASVSISGVLERYSSDRLFRVLGSGAAALVHYFDDMESFGLNTSNCIVFDDIMGSRHRALEALSWPKDKLRDLARNGSQLAHTKHTWAARFKELAHKLHIVRGQ